MSLHAGASSIIMIAFHYH